jgi:CDP-paratose 2-epimerase
VSVLEAFKIAEAISGKRMLLGYVNQPRSGDHICYFPNLTKMKAHYPGWGITKSVYRRQRRGQSALRGRPRVRAVHPS